MNKITQKTYLQWYEQMLLWRKFEDKCSALYIQQKIRGFLHLYNGQEAVLAGITHAMDREKDRVITAYRSHIHPISMGTDPRYIMAELLGKKTGTSKGKGGSMHIFSKEHRAYGGHGIVGGQIPIGAGLAFADKYFGRDSVTFTFMGDGAIRQGSFHETMNLAMNWTLPVLFIIENNGYAMGTSVARTANHTELYKLGLGYAMPSESIDGMNPATLAKKIAPHIDRARKGGGPALIEVKTYRYKGHSMSDAQLYRTKQEVSDYQKKDPIVQVLDEIKRKKYATEEELAQIVEKVQGIVKECVDFATESPFPDPEALYEDIYDQKEYPFLS